jgi:hypothetical protein
MRTKVVTIPELTLMAGTRVALGAGLGLLLSGGMTRDQRKAAGWALVAVGALTTIPMAMQIHGEQRVTEEPAELVVDR